MTTHGDLALENLRNELGAAPAERQATHGPAVVAHAPVESCRTTTEAREPRLWWQFGWKMLVTLALVMLLQFEIYRRFFAGDPGFPVRYGWWLAYLDMSVVALLATVGYLRSYHLTPSHMLGMMIGMVIGMQFGTMLGAVIGATNGFFIGAVTGMSLGASSGIYIGRCCGSTMAIVQGLMSGVMSGSMGAMLIVMMLMLPNPNDVLLFMSLLLLANLLILAGFAHLFQKEGVATRQCAARRPMSFLQLFGFSLLLTGALSALMVAGPKGSMVWMKASAPMIGMGERDGNGGRP